MTWLKLAHNTCIVTGAGSGIGAAVAKALAAEQCHIVLADRNDVGMERTAQESIPQRRRKYSVTLSRVMSRTLAKFKI
jgi:NAD(P)-dependent dehydrogenase (short-subunit alcohol dehydrogenase family)